MVERLLPYWYDFIAPDLLPGERVLVTAHGNSLRALMATTEPDQRRRHLALEVPTGASPSFTSSTSICPAGPRSAMDERRVSAGTGHLFPREFTAGRPPGAAATPALSTRPPAGAVAAGAADAWLTEQVGGGPGRRQTERAGPLAVGGLEVAGAAAQATWTWPWCTTNAGTPGPSPSACGTPFGTTTSTSEPQCAHPRGYWPRGRRSEEVALGLLDARLVVNGEQLASQNVLTRVARLWQARQEQWLSS